MTRQKPAASPPAEARARTEPRSLSRRGRRGGGGGGGGGAAAAGAAAASLKGIFVLENGQRALTKQRAKINEVVSFPSSSSSSSFAIFLFLHSSRRASALFLFLTSFFSAFLSLSYKGRKQPKKSLFFSPSLSLPLRQKLTRALSLSRKREESPSLSSLAPRVKPSFLSRQERRIRRMSLLHYLSNCSAEERKSDERKKNGKKEKRREKPRRGWKRKNSKVFFYAFVFEFTRALASPRSRFLSKEGKNDLVLVDAALVLFLN